MTKDEALKLALSALDEVRQETFRLMRNGETLYAEKKVWMAIYTIKIVLAQPKQEPVAWEQFYPDIGKPQIAINSETVGYVAPQLKIEGARHVICQCDKCKAQPEQEPVAWISTGPARMIHWTADKPAYGDDWVPLYTTPPQRKPLTDEDVERIVREARVGEHGIGYTIARAIEAAHGIKK